MAAPKPPKLLVGSVADQRGALSVYQHFGASPDNVRVLGHDRARVIERSR